MLFIIDNGESYSSHAVYFVDTDCPADFVRKWVEAAHATILAMGDGYEFKWFEGGPCRLSDVYFSFYDMEDDPAWEREEKLRREFFATESERVLLAMAKAEEEVRLGLVKEEKARRNPKHRYHGHLAHDPATPAIDELLRRGLIDPRNP